MKPLQPEKKPKLVIRGSSATNVFESGPFKP
jgi:hypothetical protein